MEANTPYALYDNDGSRTMQWAAHIRLTPELLNKLQQSPEQVLLTLNASSNGSSNSGASADNSSKSAKKTSLLSVDMGDAYRQRQRSHAEPSNGAYDDDSDAGTGIARYELHSFKEDPRVNYLCAFRRDAVESDSDVSTTATNAERGCSIFTIGKIYQKLIVQRQLDSTEKGRMKDRHAQSVIESRSRASKLLEPDDATRPAAAGKRRRVTLFSAQPSRPSTRAVSDALPATRAAANALPSALSAANAQRTKERIERGFTPRPPPAPPVTTAITSASLVVDAANTATNQLVQTSSSSAKPTCREHAPSLFSSSESDASGDEQQQQQQRTSSPRTVPTAAKSAEPTGRKAVEPTALPPRDSPDAAVPAPSAAAALAPVPLPPAALKAPALPAVRNPAGIVETKRPVVRAARVPDLSNFAPEVAAICKKVAKHITRSAILDDADYSAFERLYESLYADWATLDKAYSIEMINIESVHIRAELARDANERARVEREQQANEKKREALLYVHDTMASTKKILASLQMSIARYDQKLV